MSPRLAILLGAAAAAILGGALLLLLLQDAIARALLSPRTPFQVAAPPPAPDYAERASWLLWPEGDPDGAAADIFYVHSTTYYSAAGWNAPIDDAESDATLKRLAAPNEAGPFLEVGPVYGPRYRQATLFAFFTHKYDGTAARKAAYADVRRAFEAFLLAADGDRPLILVGYGQGGLHVAGLLKDYFQADEDLRGRLAAAYVIGQATPLSAFEGPLALTPPCETAASIRCVVAYSDFEPRFESEMRRLRDRSMMWTASGDLVATKDEPLLCVNPIGWTPGADYRGPEAHAGAASATGLRFGETPPPVRRAVGARCVDGVLVVDRPAQDFLRRRDWFGAEWKASHYNLFYFDLAIDARGRAERAAKTLEEEYFRLDPIEDTVEVEVSPVNRVPNP